MKVPVTAWLPVADLVAGFGAKLKLGVITTQSSIHKVSLLRNVLHNLDPTKVIIYFCEKGRTFPKPNSASVVTNKRAVASGWCRQRDLIFISSV